jgi:hypothetical protein
MAYDFDHEAQRVIDAIEPQRGASMTVKCALREAYAAGLSDANVENVYIVQESGEEGCSGGLRGIHESQALAEAEIADICAEHSDLQRSDFIIHVSRIRREGRAIVAEVKRTEPEVK